MPENGDARDASRPDREEYTHGYGAASEEMARRSAESSAAFFLPHLKSGMRLLDVGCGPGSITLGLAEVVAPGEVVGIDIGESEIEEARSEAEKRGTRNSRFEGADACELPFEDGSFGAVFSSAMLEHLRRPFDALKEMHRVLRTGGVIGLRAGTVDGLVFGPMTPALEHSRRVFRELWRHGGGDPEFGREQLRLVHEAGFSRPRFSAAARARDPLVFGPMAAEVWKEPARVRMAIELRLADREDMEAISVAWDEWGRDPAACLTETWLEAVAWKE